MTPTLESDHAYGKLFNTHLPKYNLEFDHFMRTVIKKAILLHISLKFQEIEKH